MSDLPNPPMPPSRAASVMNRIVASSLRQRLLVLLAMFVLIGAGWRSLQRLPVDAYPDLSPPIVEIITQWPGHSTEEVERLITVPLEIGMNGTPKTTTVRSVSLYGLSDVVLTFENGTDNYFARQQVQNRFSDVTLPSGVTPSLSPLSSPSGLIYRYVLQSADRSPMELKTFEDWVVEPQYKSVPGVADDSGFGGGEMQYQVLLDPTRIAGVGLSVAQIEAALAANNGNAGGGFYSQGGQFYYVRGLGRINTLEDIGNIVLAVNNGTPVLVKDVGRVVIGIAPRLGEFGFEKQDDAVEGVILLRTGEKTQDVLKRVEAKTKELNEQILPKDVKVVPFYDRTDLVDLTTDAVEGNLLRGMLLVVVVLVFFLYDIRAGLIVATTIPLALLFAFCCLDVQGASANLLSIGAIDFGILVDAAVVMVENIFRQVAAAQRLGAQYRRDHQGRRRRSGSAAVLRRRRDRGELPADLRADRSVRHLVQADGGHDGVRADRFTAGHADSPARAVRVVHAQRRARTAQRGVGKNQFRVRAWTRCLPRAPVAHGACAGHSARVVAAARAGHRRRIHAANSTKARCGCARRCRTRFPTKRRRRSRRKCATSCARFRK